jgi:hypothetical protein
MGHEISEQNHNSPLPMVSMDQAIADVALVLASGLESLGVSTIADADVLTSPRLSAWRQQEIDAREAVRAFLDAGRQVFTFDKTLSEALADNDLGAIQTKDIKLPFDALEIRLHGGLAINSGVLDGAIVLKRNGKLRITLMSPSPWPSLVIGGSYELSDEANVLLSEEIEDAVLKAVIDDRINDKDIPGITSALKHVTAALLYLTCYRPDREEKYVGGIARKKEELDQISSDSPRLTINNLSLEEITVHESILPEKSNGSQTRSHMRRAHWRRQRHGPKLSLVIIRWIRPAHVGGKPRDIRQNMARQKK